MFNAAPPEEPRPARLLDHLAWALKLLAISFVSLLLTYIVVGNLYLNLGLKQHASRDPRTFTMDYAWVWTLWPGHARVHDLLLTGQDSKIQWMVRVDEATVGVELLELVQQRFHATRIRAENVVWRMRFRLSDAEAEHPRARALPPIPGFIDPPMLPIGAPKPEPTDEDYNLWTAHLEGIDAEVQEIWIQDYRFTGDARLRGDFFFKPLRRVDLQPTRLEVRSGDLQVGEHVALTGIEGTLRAMLEPFDPRSTKGNDVVHALTATASIHAQVPGLEFLRHHLDPKAPELRDGSGAIDVDAGLERGVLTPGSKARVATQHLEVSAKDFGVQLAAEAALQVRDDGRGELRARVERAELRWPDGDAPVAVAEDARLSLETPADVTAPITPEVFSVDVPSLRVSDLRRILPTAPGAFRIQGGSALLRASLDRPEGGPARGELHADLWRAAARFNGIAAEASIGVDLQVDALDLAERSIQLRGNVGAGDVTVRHGEDAWRGWWAHVHLDDVLARAGEPFDVRGRARVKLRDATPIVGVLEGLDAIPPWATGLFSKGGVGIDVDLNKRGKGLAVGVHAIAGTQSVRGLLRQRGEQDERGAFLVRSGPLSAGISLGQDGAAVTPAAGDGWLNEQLAALRGGAQRQ